MGVTGLSDDSLLLSALEGVSPDRGLGGRLEVRTFITPRGGCGKALMLIVFRIVFPAEFTPGGLPKTLGVVRSFGRAGLLPPGVDGRLDVEGARRPLLPIPPAFRLEAVGTSPLLFRVFGSAGKGDVGAPWDGPECRGIDVAISPCGL